MDGWEGRKNEEKIDPELNSRIYIVSGFIEKKCWFLISQVVNRLKVSSNL